MARSISEAQESRIKELLRGTQTDQEIADECHVSRETVLARRIHLHGILSTKRKRYKPRKNSRRANIKREPA